MIATSVFHCSSISSSKQAINFFLNQSSSVYFTEGGATSSKVWALSSREYCSCYKEKLVKRKRSSDRIMGVRFSFSFFFVFLGLFSLNLCMYLFLLWGTWIKLTRFFLFRCRSSIGCKTSSMGSKKRKVVILFQPPISRVSLINRQ